MSGLKMAIVTYPTNFATEVNGLNDISNEAIVSVPR